MVNTLRNTLRTDNDLKLLVGTDSKGYAKIYSVIAPEGCTPPYITITQVGEPRNVLGSSIYNLQFSIFCSGYGESKHISTTLTTKLKSLDGYNNVFAVYPDNEQDMYEPTTKLYHIPLDITMYKYEPSISY